MKHVYHLFFLIVILSVSGCAGFLKKDFRRDYIKIQKDNISRLSGTYKIIPAEKYGKQTLADTLKRYYNLYNTVTDKMIMNNDTVGDNIGRYRVNIAVINKKEIKISLMKDSSIVHEKNIKGRLRNGIFRLNNSFLNCHGIPYLFGGCYNTKRRLALSAGNHLIVNEAVDNTGALLFVIGSGYHYNSSWRYERVGNE